MIEKRRTSFERYCHRGDVDFDQQIVWQVSHYVGQQRRIDDSGAVGFGKPWSREN